MKLLYLVSWVGDVVESYEEERQRGYQCQQKDTRLAHVNISNGAIRVSAPKDISKWQKMLDFFNGW